MFCAGFLAIISAAQPTVNGMNPTEKWVVAHAAGGQIADLSKQFPEEKERKLRGHFLENLLVGALPGVRTASRPAACVGRLRHGRTSGSEKKFT
jgi:hypothetical protein